jgi:hypothetical protein
MSKYASRETTQDRKLPIDTQFDYDKLIDMKADQLDAMVKECEINMERLRSDIVKNYQKAQPYLTQMRLLKQQLKRVSEKMEAAKTFLSMEKNGSLVSSIDLVELKKTMGEDNRSSVPPTPIPDTPRDEPGSSAVREPVDVPHKLNKTPTKFKSPLVMNWVNKNKDPVTKPIKRSSTVSNLKKSS